MTHIFKAAIQKNRRQNHRNSCALSVEDSWKSDPELHKSMAWSILKSNMDLL